MPVVQLRSGGFEAGTGALDADEIPHEGLEVCPVYKCSVLWKFGVDRKDIASVLIEGWPGGIVGGDGCGGEQGMGATPAEGEALEQGVGGEAVGAVDAGAGDFADGVEAGDRGAAPCVGANAAHPIVGGGGDRDGVSASRVFRPTAVYPHR